MAEEPLIPPAPLAERREEISARVAQMQGIERSANRPIDADASTRRLSGRYNSLSAESQAARPKEVSPAVPRDLEDFLNQEVLRRQQLEGELRDFKGKCDLLLGHLNEAIGLIQQLGNQAQRAPRLEMVGKALVAGLAHDLRNPLAVIQSCSQSCLANKKLSKTDRKHLKMIHESSQRANSLLKQFLDFVKSGLNRQPTDINQLLIRAWDSARLDLKDPAAALDTRLGSDLPLVEADPEKLERVFINLFLNALKAAGAGGRLAVNSRLMDSGNWVEVEIIDNGPGIPPSERSRLFEPFFSTRKDGTGLGLFLCKTFVEDHRGKISLDGEEGRGTKVTVRLPVNGENPSFANETRAR